MSWINHLPPACWPTFWKLNFKQQLDCRFDIMDNESYFYLCFDICKYICLDTSDHFRLYLLKYPFFFKYSCINIFHRRSLYTFYYIMYVKCIYCHIRVIVMYYYQYNHNSKREMKYQYQESAYLLLYVIGCSVWNKLLNYVEFCCNLVAWYFKTSGKQSSDGRAWLHKKTNQR